MLAIDLRPVARADRAAHTEVGVVAEVHATTIINHLRLQVRGHHAGHGGAIDVPPRGFVLASAKSLHQPPFLSIWVIDGTALRVEYHRRAFTTGRCSCRLNGETTQQPPNVRHAVLSTMRDTDRPRGEATYFSSP